MAKPYTIPTLPLEFDLETKEVLRQLTQSSRALAELNGVAQKILYLVTNDLLDLPILYLSRYITHNKKEYYTLLQSIRDDAPDNMSNWINWILFMLRGIEETARDTIRLIKSMSELMSQFKVILRPAFGQQYKHELLNNLFFHPYTKIEFMEKDMMVQRKTAAKYLDKIVSLGLLEKVKMGRSNYYINTALMSLFMSQGEKTGTPVEAIESVNQNES